MSMHGMNGIHSNTNQITNINSIDIIDAQLIRLCYASELEIKIRIRQDQMWLLYDHMLDDFKQVSPIHFEFNLNKLSINAFLF